MKAMSRNIIFSFIIVTLITMSAFAQDIPIKINPVGFEEWDLKKYTVDLFYKLVDGADSIRTTVDEDTMAIIVNVEFHGWKGEWSSWDFVYRLTYSFWEKGKEKVNFLDVEDIMAVNTKTTQCEWKLIRDRIIRFYNAKEYKRFMEAIKDNRKGND